MRRRVAGLAAALLLPGCKDDTHERFVEAAIALAAIQAEEGDARCRQQPVCEEALAALRAIPATHRDHASAAKLLAAVDRARLPADAPALEAARRAGEKLAPEDPRAALPRDLPLPGANEVPAFLQGAADAGAGGAIELEGDAERTEDFGGAPEGVEPSAKEPAGAFAVPQDDEEEPVDPEVADAPEVSRARIADGRCAKEQAEVARLKEALARALADEAGAGDPGLALQRRMKRCEEHPTDPGCAPPKAELSLEEAEAAGRESTRTLDELEAGTKAAHETAHDPSLVRAERALRACLAAAR